MPVIVPPAAWRTWLDVRAPLEAVQALLAGSVDDEVGPLSCEQVADALLGEFARDRELVPGRLDAETLRLASELEERHQARPASEPASSRA